MLLGIFCQEVFQWYIWLKKVPKVNKGILKYPNGSKSIVGSFQNVPKRSKSIPKVMCLPGNNEEPAHCPGCEDCLFT